MEYSGWFRLDMCFLRTSLYSACHTLWGQLNTIYTGSVALEFLKYVKRHKQSTICSCNLY